MAKVDSRLVAGGAIVAAVVFLAWKILSGEEAAPGPGPGPTPKIDGMLTGDWSPVIS